MLILVAVTVSTTISSGLLDKAKQATTKQDSAQEVEKIGSIYQEYLVEKETGKLENTTFADYMYNHQEQNSVTVVKINVSVVIVKFEINLYTVSEDGTIVSGWTAWKDNGDGTYTKGDITVAIGDTVNYTPDSSTYIAKKEYTGYDKD